VWGEESVWLYRQDPERGGSIILRNVNIHPQDYTVSQPRRPQSEQLPKNTMAYITCLNLFYISCLVNDVNVKFIYVTYNLDRHSWPVESQFILLNIFSSGFLILHFIYLIE
jgi:hypothetical protein